MITAQEREQDRGTPLKCLWCPSARFIVLRLADGSMELKCLACRRKRPL